MTETALDRRSLSVRDLLMLAVMAAGLIMNYVAWSNRMTAVETKVDLLMTGRVSQPAK